MTLDLETTFALAQNKGYEGEMDTFKIREWVFNQKNFVGISDIFNENAIGFTYGVTVYHEGEKITTHGENVWDRYEIALCEGLQVVINTML